MTKDFNLKKEDNDLIYESPEIEKIFDKTETRSRYVTLTASTSEVEIEWGYTSNHISCNKLQAYKLLCGKNLEIEIKGVGRLILEEIISSSYIHVKIITNSKASINEVIPKTLYLLRQDIIESIITEAIYDLQNKLKEGNKND